MMTRKSNLVRPMALGLTVVALGALAALIIAWWPGSTQPASADFPHTGIDLSVGVGTQCDSSGASTKCTFSPGGTFTLDYKLNAIPAGFGYAGYDIKITFAGVTANQASLVQQGAGVWAPCTFPASDFSQPGAFSGACAFGIGAMPSTYLGVLMHLDFTCAASGTIALAQGAGNSDLVDDGLAGHGEAEGSETLTINCGAGTPVPTTPPGPTNTPGPTSTPRPPNTPRPPTATPRYPTGDASCDNQVNPIDAQLILQKSAGLLAQLPCPAQADANVDGMVNAIDAQLILQFAAGLLRTLPPA